MCENLREKYSSLNYELRINEEFRFLFNVSLLCFFVAEKYEYMHHSTWPNLTFIVCKSTHVHKLFFSIVL